MFKVNSNFVKVSVSDGSVLLYDEEGNIHSLNESAKLVYDWCVEGKSFDQICEDVKFLYGDIDEVESILQGCIDDFKKKGIILP